ncbi:type II toxin-antitoxin system RelE/ParE family toxin [uncultured Lamprocystis sp.]|jgi:toxin ParE1/3/4|uniref:type II toxin-antitoxin system RelE/ParE family toxin n=1 Tax=uncultured Lamprocystis sp. TaxID=543132 RepID=UPI0025D95870|nr:type II toxin-antitoxin system RelE/ParE family toxin [uncultured Lamprocystis sp.]
MRVELSAYVEPDLDEIAAYIAADHPARAVSFIDEIAERFKRIGENPRLYQVRPDIRPDMRLAVHGKYLIMFWILVDSVSIERVVHGSRNLVDLAYPEGHTGNA